MKYLFIILLSLASTSLSAQWHSWDSLPYSKEVLRAQFINVDTGFFIDQKSDLYRTYDGGINWKSIFSSLSNPPLAYQFMSSTHGWIRQCDFTLMQTTDGGETWQNITLPFQAEAGGVYFLNTQVGWILTRNDQLLQTNDGGNTWQLLISNCPGDFQFVKFHDEFNGFQTSLTRLYTTSNGGLNWNTKLTLIWPEYIREAEFTDPLTGWYISSSGFYYTNDGGNNWLQLDSTINSGGLHFINQDTGYLHRNDSIYITYNHGIDRSLSGVFPLDNNIYPSFLDHLIFAGTLYGDFYRSPDGGQSWQKLSQNHTDLNLLNGFALDSLHVWVGADSGRIFYSPDGNQTWITQYIGMSIPVEDVCFSSLTHGIAVSVLGKCFYTNDGGNTWIPSVTPLYFDGLQSVCSPDGIHAWAVGFNGRILYSADGGINWSVQNSGTTEFLDKVKFFDTQNGFIKGLENIYFTNDGGNTWQSAGNPDLGHLASFNQYDLLHGDARFTRGWLKTHDGWNTFTIISLHPTYFGRIYMVDSISGWRIYSPPGCAAYCIQKTVNGGISWMTQTTIGPTFNHFFFADSEHAWVTGTKGLLKYTSNGGGFITGTNAYTDVSPALSRAYPNPTGTGTVTIAFSVPPGSGSLRFELFDLRGRLMKTANPEYFAPGDHTLQFEVTNELPAGVYFYRISGMTYSTTGKIVVRE